MDEDEDTRLERMLEGGSDLLSQMVGASASLLGPGGVLAAPAVAWITKSLLMKVGGAVAHMVGQAGAARAGAALIVIAEDAEDRQSRGEVPRDDGFAESRDGHRPDSDELLEGVLMQAAASYEQRKVILLGHLFDGIAFDPSVSVAEGHFLLKLADRLTYRQLVALTVLGDASYKVDLAMAATMREVGQAKPSPSLALEIDDLADQGVIALRVEGKEDLARPSEVFASAGPASNNPFQNLKPWPVGATLLRLMRLPTSIPDEDRQAFLADLAIPRVSE